MLSPELSLADQAAFEAFVAASPYGACQQTRAWAANVPKSRRQDYLLFLCREGEAVVGAGAVRRSRLGPFARLATLQRGPVVDRVERLGAVASALKQALRDNGCSTLVLGPRIGGDGREEALRALSDQGFARLPERGQSLHIVTGTIDLRPGEDAILAGFKQRGRRQIRNASKQGVSVRPASSGPDVEAYQRVLGEFQRLRPDYDTRGLPDAFQQAAIVRANGGAILLAEKDGEVIGGHAFVVQGGDAMWLSMATLDSDPSVPRAYLLLWEAIRLARQMGCRRYDLAGLAGGGEDAGGGSGDGGEAGRDQFKTAFAPAVDKLVPAHVAPLRPLRHLLFFNARQYYRTVRNRMRAARSGRP
ncbi:MAG TPA: GNAT family N-acetyltransferase [Allosphingosinicella sp.]|nr:GNAT family N-acetyltransferase [Allosphingosinicella sp.]